MEMREFSMAGYRGPLLSRSDKCGQGMLNADRMTEFVV